jgi:phenylacetic acid degradation operon negative regulatory protein
MSTITSAPTSYFVYSSLSFYAGRRDDMLPGRWFVQALADAGQEEASVRQTLHRLERADAIRARQVGREKFYSAAPFGRAEIDAGLSKIFGAAPEPWDGMWTVVVSRFPPDERSQREQLRGLMEVEGFATLAPGVFIHPHASAIARLEKAAEEANAPKRYCSIRGPLAGDLLPDNVAALWNFNDLAKRYRRFVKRFEPRLRERSPAPRDCFVQRFDVVFEFLGIAWEDPEMPPELLPSSWPAGEARNVARRLYERLLPGAIRHADAVYESLNRGA